PDRRRHQCGDRRPRERHGRERHERLRGGKGGRDRSREDRFERTDHLGRRGRSEPRAQAEGHADPDRGPLETDLGPGRARTLPRRGRHRPVRNMADIVDKSWDVQRRIEERVTRLGKRKYGRVLKLARKRTSDESSKVVMITGTEDGTIRLKIDLVYNSELPDPPEWTVKLFGVEDKVWDVTFTKVTEKEFMLIADGQREITLSVTCPKGARYGDRLNVVVNAISKGDPGAFDAKTLSFSARQAILAVKSSIGHERAVADAIYARARAKDVGVFSILVPANFRGYVYVESMNPDRLEEIVRGLRRARGVVKGEGESTGISFNEIEAYLTPKPIVSGIMEGDIVELVAGPFKGEKARVMKIDETKEEITVELFEAMVRIPVTVRGDSVRVLQKEEDK